MSKQLAVLKGIKHGNVFFTSFDGDKDKIVRTADGKVSYILIAITNSDEKAQKIWRKHHGPTRNIPKTRNRSER